MNILAIETSCDETSVAVVRDGRHIRSNVISSQIPLHQKYGGVVPELASRQHVVTILPVLDEALSRAGAGWDEISAIAVTRGPGLAPALLVGVNVAKGLAFARGKPLLGVNHMEGHIYSNWLIPPEASDPHLSQEPLFPALCLIVSGGHTELLLMSGHGEYRLLGKTVDDAAGEAFDKAARVLGLGYPGGPAIQKAAAGGDGKRFALPRAKLPDTYDFSFSGLKTALLRKAEEHGLQSRKSQPWQKVDAQQAPQSAFQTGILAEGGAPVADLAASFQAAVVDALVEKTAAAAEEFSVREVLVAGGVAANSALRAALRERLSVPLRYPLPVLCTDNAAMIGAAAFYLYDSSLQSGLAMDIEPNARYY